MVRIADVRRGDSESESTRISEPFFSAAARVAMWHNIRTGLGSQTNYGIALGLMLLAYVAICRVATFKLLIISH
jgi:hypothetical protein